MQPYLQLVSSTADLQEALQPPERLATTSEVAESAYRSPNKVRQATNGVNKPILVAEAESEALQAERPSRRPKRNAKLPKRFKEKCFLGFNLSIYKVWIGGRGRLLLRYSHLKLLYCTYGSSANSFI
jgi:hypothetical protein